MIFFASCGKRVDEKNSEENLLLSHIKQQEVPVPVGFIPQPSLNSDSRSNKIKSMCYKGNLSIDQSINFYKQKMELRGWEIKDFSTNQEGLLFCNKAQKHCAISIRESIKQASSHKTSLRVQLENSKHYSHEDLQSYPDEINKKQVDI
jgi:hypothetical protein